MRFSVAACPTVSRAIEASWLIRHERTAAKAAVLGDERLGEHLFYYGLGCPNPE
jgi:hypothetical protein